MTSKKYLSNKKTTQQTISISPSLKEWIKRYVNVNRRKFPKDKRFKSISAFYTHLLEEIMELFEKGKTLDDFERVEDKEVKDFFDKFQFRATVPLYEMVSENNRYAPLTVKYFTRFIMYYLNFLKKNFRERNYEDLQILFEKIRNRVNPSPISKEMRLEITTNKNQRFATTTYEFIGKQRNLHFENCKFLVAVFGILGVKITDFIYSPKDFYFRCDFIETDLLFRKDLARKERMELLKENVNFLINYNRLLEDDDDKHLWMKIAQDPMLFVSFKSKRTFNKWLKRVENDLKQYGNKDGFLRKILLFFQKLHWIRIINEKNLAFEIEQALKKNGEERNWLIQYLSKHSNLSQKNGLFSLKE